MDQLKSFLRRTDGAITVDWVVLSAAVILMTIYFISDMGTNVNSASKTTVENVQKHTTVPTELTYLKK